MESLDREILSRVESIPGIAALLVFGSRAAGTPRPHAPVDPRARPWDDPWASNWFQKEEHRVPRENFASTVGAWRRFLDSVDDEVAQLPEVKRQLAQLEAMYRRVQELVHERAALQAAKQTATQELRGLLQNGRITITYLRKGVRLKFGKTSERLVQYGLQPFRGRARRKKVREPDET